MQSLFNSLKEDVVDFHVGLDSKGVYYYEKTAHRPTGTKTYYNSIEELLEQEDLLDNYEDLL